MSDPADKSDDLIAELAKLMATTPGSPQPSAAPRPTPSAAAGSPPPVRIPGMDAPRPAAPAPQAAAPAPSFAPSPSPAPSFASTPQPAPAAAPAAPRAPLTGAIRIPGMDTPAPVATSAPVSKFDFGKPVTPIVAPRAEAAPSSLAERLAPQRPGFGEPPMSSAPRPAPAAPASPVRVPSDLKPVSESKGFGQGPSITPPPASPPPSDGGFSFDFGLGKPAAPEPAPSAKDPIADLIAAETLDNSASDDSDDADDFVPAPKPAAAPRPAPAPVPLKPVTVAPRAPEVDRFSTAPSAGLSMKAPASRPLNPAPPAPEPVRPSAAMDQSDPMSEIENLIGEAVRVELSAPGPVKVQATPAPEVPVYSFDDEPIIAPSRPSPQPVTQSSQPAQPAPVVPPLGSPFAPRRSGLREETHSSPEDAILAAAAATGARVDTVEPNVSEDSPYRRVKLKSAKPSMMSGGMRQYVGMAVAGTLLLAAGLGLYWVLNMGRGAGDVTGADAPVLTADTTPVKEVPEATAADADTARSPVLEQIDGAAAQPSTEQLVSTDETGGAPVVTRDVGATETADAAGGLANRKVRTVTVRPDGTIVSGDDAVAGAEELPVDRPNVPEVPSVGDDTNLLSDPTQLALTQPATVAEVPATTATTAATSEVIEPVFGGNKVAPTPLTFPGRMANQPAASTPVAITSGELTGASTPDGQIDLLGGGQTTSVTPAPVAAAPVASSGGSGAFVQLSSSPTEADANASMRTLNNRYGSLFGGNQLTVQSADLGQKGVWYRVKLPVSSLSEAQSICASIKANGGDCIVGAS